MHATVLVIICIKLGGYSVKGPMLVGQFGGRGHFLFTLTIYPRIGQTRSSRSQDKYSRGVLKSSVLNIFSLAHYLSPFSPWAPASASASFPVSTSMQRSIAYARLSIRGVCALYLNPYPYPYAYLSRCTRVRRTTWLRLWRCALFILS